jgi:hypothetical protein
MTRAWIAIALVAACGGRAGDDTTRCLAAGTTIGHVGRCDLGVYSYRFAMNADFGRGAQHQQRTLRWLVDRELLAQAALDAGEPAPTADAMGKRLEKGEAYLFGVKLSNVPWLDEQGFFDFHALERYAGGVGVTVEQVVAEEGREQLAVAMIARIGPDKIDAWLLDTCHAAKAAGAITIDPTLIASFDPCP